VIGSYNGTPGVDFAYPFAVRYHGKVYTLWLSRDDDIWYLYKRVWRHNLPPDLQSEASPVAYSSADGYPQGIVYAVSFARDTLLPRRYLGGTFVPQPIRSHDIRREYFVFAYENSIDGYLAIKRDIGLSTMLGGPLSQEIGKRKGVMLLGIEPNPVSSDLKFLVEANGRCVVNIKIYDESGRIVKRKQVKVRGRRVEIPAEIKEMGAGIYFYDVELAGEKYRGSFVKVK